VSEATDLELVRRANGGDGDAFEALYRRHRDWVLRLAERYTGNRDDALDVLQDAFAHLFGRFPGFALTAELKTFLYPVVRHLALDRLRRRRPTVDVATLADTLPAPPVTAADGDLARLVAALPATQREVLALRYADDLSLNQIADALGVPLGTVKSRLHAALCALRDRFAQRTT
jgi:RNA polymerase sigma-70 factor (ECF subfamily)